MLEDSSLKFMSLPPLPPLGCVKEIQLFMPTAEHVRKMSVLEIRHVNDITSKKLGVEDWNEACHTCTALLDDCPGHMGHMELAIPVYKVHVIKNIEKMLNAICFYCYKLRLPTESPEYEIVKKTDQRHRLDELIRYSNKYKRCGFNPRGKVKVRDGCCHPFVKYETMERNCPMHLLATIYLTDEDKNSFDTESNWRPIHVGPNEVLEVFRKLSVESMYMLGCHPIHSPPESFLWEALPVPSRNCCPTHTFAGVGGKKNIFAFWVTMMKQIFRYKIELDELDMISDHEEMRFCRYSYNNNESFSYVEALNCTDVTKKKRQRKMKESELVNDNMSLQENAYRNMAMQIAAFMSKAHKKHGTKGVSFSNDDNVEMRFSKPKDARIRGNVFAKRTENSMRSVLRESIHLYPTNCEISQDAAMILVKREYKTARNFQKIQRLILNGTDTYPGANYVVLKNGKKVDLSFDEQRRDIDLSDVTYVLRHVVNGDAGMLNRQPTLHRLSMIKVELRIVRGISTIGVHPCLFNGLGADCDGDEVKMSVFESVEADAELDILMPISSVIMKGGKVWAGFIQQAIVGAHLMTVDGGRYFDFEDMIQMTSVIPSCWAYPPRREKGYHSFDIISILFPPHFTAQTKKYCIRDGKFISGVLDNESLNGRNGVLEHIYRDYEDKNILVNFLYSGYLLFHEFIDIYGLSAGFMDLCIDPRDWQRNTSENDPVQSALNRMKKVKDAVPKVFEYINQFPDHIPDGDEIIEGNINDVLSSLTQAHLEPVKEYLIAKDPNRQNGLLQVVLSGQKNFGMFNQMAGCVSQIYTTLVRFPHVSSHFLKGKSMAVKYGFIENCYSEGLTEVQTMLEAPAATEGVIHKNKGTAKSGHCNRRMDLIMMGTRIDWHGRAVDSLGKILWNVYGNDGYDPMTLTRDYTSVVESSEQDVRDQFDVFKIEVEKYLCPFVYDMWSSNTNHGVFKEEIERLVTLRKTLRNYVTHADGESEMRSVVSPFNFDHLFRRCKVLHPSKLSDLNPSMIPIAALGFWNKLEEEKGVVPTNIWLKILFFDKLSTVNILKNTISLKGLQWMFLEMHRIIRKCVIQPGESVGMNAAQCMGEPTTQMSLKTPHFSGRSKKVTSGIDRISNIIDGIFHSPVMEVWLEEDFVKDEIDSEIFGLRLSSGYLTDILRSPPIFVNQIDSFKIQFHLSRELGIRRMVYPRDIALKIGSKLGISMKNFDASFADELDWKLSIYIPKTSIVWNEMIIQLQKDRPILAEDYMTAEFITIYNIVRNIEYLVILYGWKGIENFTVENRIIHTADRSSKRWFIETLGTNLKKIMRIPGVDTSRTSSSDLSEVGDVLGMYAARKALVRDLKYLMKDRTDERHIDLIARKMTSMGKIRGMKINQMGEHIGPIQQESYEQCPRMMTLNCALGSLDNVKTMVSSIFANKRMDVGTGYGLELLPWDSLPTDKAIETQKSLLKQCVRPVRMPYKASELSAWSAPNPVVIPPFGKFRYDTSSNGRPAISSNTFVLFSPSADVSFSPWNCTEFPIPLLKYVTKIADQYKDLVRKGKTAELEVRIGSFTSSGRFYSGVTQKNLKVNNRFIKMMGKTCEKESNWTSDPQVLYFVTFFDTAPNVRCIIKNNKKEYQRKVKVSEADLRCSNRDFSLRMSLAVEQKLDSKIYEKLSVSKPNKVRVIQRSTFHGKYDFDVQVDVSKTGEGRRKQDITCANYEMEMEFRFPVTMSSLEICHKILNFSSVLLGSHQLVDTVIQPLDPPKLELI
jgi:DNA-directed RNA polymerase II subunit RPB1